MKQLNEIIRIQQLAGINEITVNNPIKAKYKLTSLAKKYLTYLPERYNDIEDETGNDIIPNNLSYIKEINFKGNDYFNYNDAYDSWQDMIYYQSSQEYESSIQDIINKTKLILK
jgi:hypothetical protein